MTDMEDAFSRQEQRFRRLLEQRALGTVIEFEEGPTPDWIKFRVIDPVNNVVLGVSESRQLGAIAALSDDELWAYIRKITAERL